MHRDEVETEQEDGVHLEKCSDAMILSVAAGAAGDRLNMKLSHHCSLSPDQTVSINGTAPRSIAMQLHPPHYQLSDAGRQKLEM